uniref:Protein kinase domain-containing protein n=1 Tax=Rhabditophanes sp. KR3021 TaxID=114890 RepID=A0AC35TJF4_9BILA
MQVQEYQRVPIIPLERKLRRLEGKFGTIEHVFLQKTKSTYIKKELEEFIFNLNSDLILLPSLIKADEPTILQIHYDTIPNCACISSVIERNYPFGLPEKAIAYIANQLLCALEYLEQKRIVHRSVKCSNVFVDTNGDVKLGGLHTAIHLDKKKFWIRTSNNVNEFDADILKDSLFWLAPEVLKQDLVGYNTKSDVYSYGIVIVEAANGFAPFSDMEKLEMLYEKLQGTTPKLLDSRTISEEENFDSHRNKKFSDEFHELVPLILDCNQDTRLTLNDLRVHPFIIKHNINQKQSLTDLLPLLTIA